MSERRRLNNRLERIRSPANSRPSYLFTPPCLIHANPIDAGRRWQIFKFLFERQRHAPRCSLRAASAFTDSLAHPRALALTCGVRVRRYDSVRATEQNVEAHMTTKIAPLLTTED